MSINLDRAIKISLSRDVLKGEKTTATRVQRKNVHHEEGGKMVPVGRPTIASKNAARLLQGERWVFTSKAGEEGRGLVARKGGKGNTKRRGRVVKAALLAGLVNLANLEHGN